MSEKTGAQQGELQVYRSRIAVQSQQGPEFIDLTDVVLRQLERCPIREGYALVFSRHTTAGVVIQENEPLLLQDMARKLNQIAPPEESYAHDDFSIRTENLIEEMEANGHAHCQGLFIGQSVHAPIEGGKLAIGRWQRIFLLELDSPRAREVIVQFVGIE
ncbi:MAG: YjbQ family protein [Candidatus Eremiobacteraeota bacterium]|nr:YjbQ family protein [Candidatus Eremiobacteraeota bacterium]